MVECCEEATFPLRLTITQSPLPETSEVNSVMDRRTFVGAVAGALLATPLAAKAQQTGKVFRIGLLGNISLAEPEGARLWGAFIQGLRDLGYVEGQNITIELRTSEGKYERLPSLAAELVRLNVDVIVVPADQNARAAEQATRTIPIVMIGNPVGSGLVANLARPGGNITGLSILAPEIVGKQLQLIKELIPRVSSAAVLSNPTNPGHVLALEEAKIAARSLGMELQLSKARGPDELEGAFAGMTRAHVGAVLVLLDGMFLLHQSRSSILPQSTVCPQSTHAGAMRPAAASWPMRRPSRRSFGALPLTWTSPQRRQAQRSTH